MKALVEAYGCTLNYGESREIEDLLVSRGYELVSSPEECDLAIIVTCVVIDRTERAMLKRIEELAHAPRLVVTGCMATACREKAERIAPEASFVAPGDLASFSELLEACPSGKNETGRSRDSYVIVPISSGCLGSCAYCITKLARGTLRSRSSERIVAAVRRATSRGPREVQLTAQDTAAYGRDIGRSLPGLVEGICRIEADFRLRIGMMNPSSALPIMDELADMYAQQKVFKFLHLPVQSASDRLLREMERGYTLEDYREIVARVRSRVPRITLSTDLIVGYPGETEHDHSMNMRFVEELSPDIVNVTRFSARPGTKAANAGGQVVGWKAKERSRALTELRFRVSLEKNEGLVGNVVRALSTEKGKNGSTILRTEEYKQVVVPKDLDLGRYYDVKIVSATPTYVNGAWVES